MPLTGYAEGEEMTLTLYESTRIINYINNRRYNMKKSFDYEYSTQYVKEMKYLESIGIKYNFVKDINGITTYKYSKNSKLFKALSIFYEQFDK